MIDNKNGEQYLQRINIRTINLNLRTLELLLNFCYEYSYCLGPGRSKGS